ncbi:hypothetical protein NMY22_g20237 [Coprinellus aureogranulatus]|nr:hypothetical protein NMY22_g20237 [Coprinellus aureogranulatus]
MKITVKTTQQKVYQLDVEGSDSIATLKAKIEQEHAHPVSAQKIIYSGKILSDDKTIESCGIKEKDFLVLMVSKPKPAAVPAAAASTSAAPPRILAADDQNQHISSPALDYAQQQQQSRLFQSPALVSDALRRLSAAARDRHALPFDSRKHESDLNILRTMTNLLTVSRQKVRRDSVTSGVSRNYSLLPTRRSNVFMMDTMNLAGPDRLVAVDYVFMGASLIEVCERNARVAKERGRWDHERVFRTVQALFRVPEKREDGQGVDVDDSFSSDLFAIGVIMQLYTDLAKNKDIQMLAMLSVIVLQTPHGSNKSRLPPTLVPAVTPVLPEIPGISRLPPIKTTGFNDYFSLARSINNMPSPMSPAWPGSIHSANLNNTTPSPRRRWRRSPHPQRQRHCPLGSLVEQFERELE